MHLFDAMRGERIVTVIIIGLIELVAALNILIVLVMMVMEKLPRHCDFDVDGRAAPADPHDFHAAGRADRRGGSAIGLTVGYTLCYFAEKYKWIRIDESVYACLVRAVRDALGARHLDRRRGHFNQLSGNAVPREKRHADRAGGSPCGTNNRNGALGQVTSLTGPKRC